MNHWKQVWDAYHGGATKRAFAKELWRLSGWASRVVLLLGTTLLVWGVISAFDRRGQQWPWAFVIGELTVLAVLRHVKSDIFQSVYGAAGEDLSPSDDGGNRSGVFLCLSVSC